MNEYNLPFIKQEISEEQKEDIVKLLFTIISISKKAWIEGLLSIDKDIEDIEDPFLQHGLELVLSGVFPNDIEAVLINYLMYGGYNENRQRLMSIIIDGTIAIHKGKDPEILALILAGYLGESGLKLVKNIFYKNLFSYDHAEIKRLDPELTLQCIAVLSGIDLSKFEQMIKTIPRVDISMAIIPISGQLLYKLYQFSLRIDAESPFSALSIISIDVTADKIVESQRKIIDFLSAL